MCAREARSSWKLFPFSFFLRNSTNKKTNPIFVTSSSPTFQNFLNLLYPHLPLPVPPFFAFIRMAGIGCRSVGGACINCPFFFSFLKMHNSRCEHSHNQMIYSGPLYSHSFCLGKKKDPEYNIPEKISQTEKKREDHTKKRERRLHVVNLSKKKICFIFSMVSCFHFFRPFCLFVHCNERRAFSYKKGTLGDIRGAGFNFSNPHKSSKV